MMTVMNVTKYQKKRSDNRAWATGNILWLQDIPGQGYSEGLDCHGV